MSGPAFDPNWSPDGTTLVFAPINDGGIQKQDRRVSVVDLETGEVRMLPGSEGLFSPYWSLGAKHLVAVRWGQFQPAIYDFETRGWADVNAKWFGFPS
jgi:Tol biopolymer transport system component